jgi:PIN domain nuclease of toxin-antitoxin system
MIILDTHIWVWWIHGNSNLSQSAIEMIQFCESSGIGISVISCWEVAKLVEYQRLKLPCEVLKWLNQALAYPGVRLVELTPEIVVASTQLVGFHRDPAAQIIVATAKVYRCPLVTVDAKIIRYPDIQTVNF